MPNARDLVRTARRRLAEAGIEAGEAALDAGLIVRDALGWDRARLVADGDAEVGDEPAARIDRHVARRARREPLSHILGRREFYGLEFEVSRDVLTPRPETELVVESALERTMDRRTAWRIADVGTGSGCLAVTLAHERPMAIVVATDVSAAALAVARRNAARHGVADRIAFVQAWLVEGLRGPFDVVVSNPPYIPSGDLAGLSPEVGAFEPRVALDGGLDGLDLVRALISDAAALVVPGGWLIVEIGAGQADVVRALAREAGAWEAVDIRPDLAGIPRTLVARRRG